LVSDCKDYDQAAAMSAALPASYGHMGMNYDCQHFPRAEILPLRAMFAIGHC
jgi:hypothetical protein